jgi:hypothetical protein
LQRTAASPLAGMRREPAKVLAGEGVLPAPPLPLKPTVGTPLAKQKNEGVRNREKIMKTFARWLGLFASIGCVFLYVRLLNLGITTFPIVVMLVLSITAAIASYKSKPILMAFLFLASFLPVGLYLLGTPRFYLIGILNLIYLLATILLLASSLGNIKIVKK